MVVFCVSSGVSGVICQSFLIVRVYKLTKKWYLAVGLAFTSCVAFAGTLYAGVETGLNSSYSHRAADDVNTILLNVAEWVESDALLRFVQAGVTTWLVGNACCDFLMSVDAFYRCSQPDPI